MSEKDTNILLKMKAKTITTMVVALVLIVIAGFGFLIYQGQDEPIAPRDLPAEGCPESTAILTVNAVSALNKGNSVTVTLLAGVGNDAVATNVTSGTTTFPVGASVTVLASADDYIDKSMTFTMPCGGKVLELPMYYSTDDNPAIRIKNDDDNYVTDNENGSTVNQTNIAAGETLALIVEFKGTSQESSGNGIYIVETDTNTGANITRIELDGVAGKAVPTVHSSTAAGSAFYAWNIDAIEGATTVQKDMRIILTPTGDITGSVLTDWYAEQEFVDDDGSISTGIQDSDGTAQYENTLDFDFYINAA